MVDVVDVGWLGGTTFGVAVVAGCDGGAVCDWLGAVLVPCAPRVGEVDFVAAPGAVVLAATAGAALCSWSVTCCWLKAVTVSFPCTAPRTTPTAPRPITVAAEVTATHPVT